MSPLPSRFTTEETWLTVNYVGVFVGIADAITIVGSVAVGVPMDDLTAFLDAVRGRLIQASLRPDVLNAMIKSLEECQKQGVKGPWYLSDGTSIEPIEVLRELRQLRTDVTRLERLVRGGPHLEQRAQIAWGYRWELHGETGVMSRLNKHELLAALARWQAEAQKEGTDG